MRPLFRFAVWSNAFYLVPLITAAYFELWGVAFLLTGLLVFSTLFHYSHEVSYVLADKLAAYSVIVVNLILLVLGGLNNTLSLTLIGAVFALGLYVRYVQEKGDHGGFYHGVWHLCAASATALCIVAYAM